MLTKRIKILAEDKRFRTKDQETDGTLKGKLIQFFTENPYPPDNAVHAFARRERFEPDEVEAAIYSILSDFLKGAGEDKEPDKSWKPQYGIGKDGAGEDAWVKFKNYAFSKGYKNKEVGDLSFTNSKGKIIKLKSAIGGKLKVYEEGVGVYEVNDTADPDFLRMYEQKLEDAIDSGDKEEMKRWSRQLLAEVMGTRDGKTKDSKSYFSTRNMRNKIKDESKPSGKLEIESSSGNWIEVNWDVFRSWSGNRRVDGKPYTGSVYYFNTKEKTGDEDTDQGFDVRNIEEETTTNDNFRKVVFTGNNLQLVLMSLLPNEDIGMEVHEKVDQFFRIDSGSGELEIEGEGKTAIKDGTSIVIKAGTHHNIIAGDDGLKLYTVYSPPNHPPDRIQATKEIAMKEEKA